MNERERDTSDGAPSDRPEPPTGQTPVRGAGLLDPFLDSSPHGALGGLAEADADDPASQASRDRWAHRRGEPRIFALLMALYLLASAMATIFAAPVLGNPSTQTFHAASQTLLILAAVGVFALWPMIRLSQAPPRRPVRAALADVVVIALLVQAVIWPTSILPGGSIIRPVPWLGLWPWSVALGLSVATTSWSFLTGALIACGTASGADWRRAVWMGVCLLVALAAPGAALLVSRLGADPGELWRLASPITVLLTLTEAPSGLSPAMTGRAWLASVAPAAASIPIWLIALARARQ